jgi:plastocyanin
MHLGSLRLWRLLILLAVVSACAIAADAATKIVNVGQGGGLVFVDQASGTSTTTINSGDTVQWNWVNGFHSTTSTNLPCCSPSGMWDSGAKSGGSFTFTFNSAGTFHYYCTVHGAVMQGTVVVNALPDFSISVSNPSGGTVMGPIFPSQQTVFNGNLSPLNGYNKTVNLSCLAGGTGVPSPCNPNPASPMVSSSTPFTITAGATTPGHYDFMAQGSDGSMAHSVSGLNFDVVDFAIGAPSPATAVSNPSSTAISTSTSVNLSAAGIFSGTVMLSCSAGLPAGATCTFTPSANATPTANNPVSVNLTITIPAATVVQDYNVTLSAASSTAAGPVTKTQPLTLHVAQLTVSSFTPGTITIGAGNISNAATTMVSVTNFTGSGTVALACTAGLPAGGACSFSPAIVSSFPSSPSVTASVPFNTSAGTPTLTVTATGNLNGASAVRTQSLMLSVPAPDFSLGTPSPATVNMVNNSFSQPVTVLLTPTNLAGTVIPSCGSLPTGVSCIFSPPTFVNVKGQPTSFAVIFAANGATASSYAGITINADVTINGTPISHNVALTQLNITTPGTSTTITSSLAAVNSVTNAALINVGDPNLTVTASVDNSGSTYSAAVWQVNFTNPVILVASSNPNCSQLLPTAISCNLGDILVSTGNHYSFKVLPLFERSVEAKSVVTSPTVGSVNLTGNSANAPAVQIRPRPLARKGLVPRTP